VKRTVGGHPSHSSRVIVDSYLYCREGGHM